MITRLERLVAKLLHFQLYVSALDLAKCLLISDCHHDRGHFIANLKLAAVDGADSVHYKRLPRGEVVSLLAIRLGIDFGDPSENEAANWDFIRKVEFGGIAELVEASPDRALVPNLNKAAGLADTGDVAEGEVSSR